MTCPRDPRVRLLLRWAVFVVVAFGAALRAFREEVLS